MGQLGVVFVSLLACTTVMVVGDSLPTIYRNELWLTINNTYTDLICYFGYVPFATYPTTSVRLCLGLATAQLASAACYDSPAANQANQELCSLWRTGLASNSTNSTSELQSLGLTGNPMCMISNSENSSELVKNKFPLYALKI